MKFVRLFLMSLVCGLVVFSEYAGATSVIYNNFSDLSNMQLNGSTASPITNPVNGDTLRLTNALWQSGSAFSKNTIALQNQSSFSSYFQFQISNPMGISDVDGQGADGIVFVVQTVSNTSGGAGLGIGYQGLPHSVGIEFDTWNNGSHDDSDGNHVGININGNIDSSVQTHVNTRMNNGDIWYAWVDYNGTTDLIEVRLAESNTRPGTATLSYTVDLVSVLGTEDAYIGFTSGTGAAGGYHDILAWQFNDTYSPIIPTPTPEPSVMYLLLAGLLGVPFIKRNKN